MTRVALWITFSLTVPTLARKTLLTKWRPQPCDKLPDGVPCTELYKHPYGSTEVMPCPIEGVTSPDGCGALFAGKADGEQCPQISCPKALGVTMKLVCAGGCCPTCWAPDHVVGLDRHTRLENPVLEPIAPMAPPSCAGASCFKPICSDGYSKGFVQGQCCYSCVPAR